MPDAEILSREEFLLWRICGDQSPKGREAIAATIEALAESHKKCEHRTGQRGRQHGEFVTCGPCDSRRNLRDLGWPI